MVDKLLYRKQKLIKRYLHFISNNHQIIPKGQSKMGNPEILAKQYTKDEEKHNTICVPHHSAQTNTNNVNQTRALLQTNTNNVNQTRALLQTTGGKTNRTSFLSENRSRHHNMELRM